MEYKTLFHLFPPYKNQSEAERQVKSSAREMMQYGREDYTPSELVFFATVDRHIEIFEKAKAMIANNRFTVEYRGDKMSDCPKIDDFEIIPVKIKDTSG